MFTRRGVILGCLFCCVIGIAMSADTVITITDLGTIGGTEASASGVNTQGEVVGWALTGYIDPSGQRVHHAFAYTAGGGMADLGALAPPDVAKEYSSSAAAINDQGQIVGRSDYVTSSPGAHYNYYHAFLYTPGLGMVDLTPSLDGLSQAWDINNAGQIVGWTETTDGPQGFLYDSITGNLTVLSSLWKAYAINDNGQIAGESAATHHAAVYDSGLGVTTELGVLGLKPRLESIAYGINNNGQIVGESETDVLDSNDNPVRRAFLYEMGAMRDLGTLAGPSHTDMSGAAFGINDRGQVVGRAYYEELNANREVVMTGNHAFLYTIGGSMRDLGAVTNSYGSSPTSQANKISSMGQVVGYSQVPVPPGGDFQYAAVSWTITDRTAPVVTVPANITAEATASAGAVVRFAASATDDTDGSVPVTCVPASGRTFPVGTTTVTCTAKDAAGNTGNASFTVTVVATTPSSRPGVHVHGQGMILVNGARATFEFNVQVTKKGQAVGVFFFDERRIRLDVDSTSITSVVVTGTHGRITGTTRVKDRGRCTFVADVDDIRDPGRHIDKFAIQVSTGLVVAPAILQRGNIDIDLKGGDDRSGDRK